MNAYARPLAPFEQRRGEPRALGVCRHCGRLAWTRDETGPVHACCELWAPKACVACADALALHKKAESWWQQRRRLSV